MGDLVARPLRQVPTPWDIDTALHRIESDLAAYCDDQARQRLERLIVDLDPTARAPLQRWLVAARAIKTGAVADPEARTSYRLARADIVAGNWSKASARLILLGDPDWQPTVSRLRGGLKAKQARLVAAAAPSAVRAWAGLARDADKRHFLFGGAMLLAGLVAVALFWASLSVSPSAPLPIAAAQASEVLAESAPVVRATAPQLVRTARERAVGNDEATQVASHAPANGGATADATEQELAARLAAVADLRAQGAWDAAVAEAEQALALRPDRADLHALRNETVRQATQAARGPVAPPIAPEAPVAPEASEPPLDSSARLDAIASERLGDSLREARVENGLARVVYKQNRGWSDGVALLSSAARFREVAAAALELPEVERLELVALRDQPGRSAGEEIILNLQISRAAASRVGLRIADPRTLPRRLSGPGVGFFVHPALLGVWRPLMPPA